MENSYTDFALVYDELMDNVDYAGWADFIRQQLQKSDIREGILLDLGCGTGTMTELLAGFGYDMIGVDASGEMLMQALDKKICSGHDILYLNQQMDGFELYGTVRAIVSVCDSLNYILEEKKLAHVFSLVHNYLDPGGMFLFDLNTPYKYESLLGDTVIAENREDASFIWENHYDPVTCLNEYLLTLFLKTENGLYRKHEELHIQKAYTRENVTRLLSGAGLIPLQVYDGYSTVSPTDNSDRWLFLAKKP